MDRIKYSKTLTAYILPRNIDSRENRYGQQMRGQFPEASELLIIVLFACLYYRQETLRCESCKSVI